MSGIDVVLVVPSLVRGGAERVTVNLANGLAARGDRPRILVAGSAVPLADAVAPDVPVTVLGRPRVRHALPAIVRELRRDPPDVVLSTHTHVNLALCAVRPLLPRRTRLVLREPTHLPPGSATGSSRAVLAGRTALYPLSDAVIASSQPMATDLSLRTRARIHVLPNPVDVASIRRRTPPPTADRTVPGRRVLSIGRLSSQKSMDELLDAFAAGSGPDDRLAILGEGPEREALERRVALLGLTGRVELAGASDDHWGRLAQADALVLASRAEGMPNVVLEALALGTPVLVTDELTVLEELATEVGPDALRMVPRSALAQAIGALPRRTGPFPSGSLLPGRFDLPSSVARFAELLHDLVRPGRT